LSFQVVQIEPLIREPTYDLDMKALRIHCRSEWDSMNINALIEKKIKEVRITSQSNNSSFI
jgi:hypothetical protein